MSYCFHPDAANEHLQAVRFYEMQQAGLGAAYLAEFEQKMVLIAARPSACRIDRRPDIRSVALMTFPYRVVFREVAGSVQVLAVSHKKRRPDYWLGRL